MVTLSPAILPVLILPYLLSVERLYCHLLFVEWLLSPVFVECLYCHTCYLLNDYIVILQMFTLSPTIRRMLILCLLSVERLYRHNSWWSSCRCGSRAVVKVNSVTEHFWARRTGSYVCVAYDTENVEPPCVVVKSVVQ